MARKRLLLGILGLLLIAGKVLLLHVLPGYRVSLGGNFAGLGADVNMDQ